MTSSSSITILFIELAILLAFVCYELKRYLKLPVTTTLIVSGIIIREIGPYIGDLDKVINAVIVIDSDLINLIFFPILIFEACYSIDWHTIRKEFWQIMPLATTVVVGCSALTALCLKYIFQYSYDFNSLFLIGVILSSTDHIAVDALLKEIYASDTFETLIGGETLFNDGTVLVLFSVLMRKVTGLSGLKESIVFFIRLTFGGLTMGIGFAIVAALLIRRILNDFFLETNILLVSAYLLFWTCELKTIHFSGGLAMVAFGLFMSAYGKTVISPSITEQLKETLEILSRNIESLVFIIAGLLFADTAINNKSSLTGQDFYTLFILFPLTYAIRMVVLLIHYPILKYSGYGISLKELIVLCFCGMKGVIAVALTLLASAEYTEDLRLKALIKYFGIGIAGLSIIIGGPITRFLVKIFGLEDMSIVQEDMLVSVTGALVNEIDEKMEKMRENKDYNLVNWSTVKDTIGTHYLLRNIIKKTKHGKEFFRISKVGSTQELMSRYKRSSTAKNSDIEIEIRRRFLETLKGVYWERFEEGLCHGDTAITLKDSAMDSIDKYTEVMSDWENTQKVVYNPKLINSLKRLAKCPGLAKIFRKLLYRYIILAYDTANNFIKAHEETEEIIDEMEIDVNEKIFKKVMAEAHDQIKECEKFMNTYIIDCYPEVLTEVQTKRACKILLYNQREMISTMYEDGIIGELEFDRLMESIDSSIQIVTFQGIPSIPILKDILKYRFTQAKLEEINHFQKKITEFEFKPGHVFFTEGEEANGAYYIIRGRVNEASTWINQELIIGNIVGVQHLLEEFSSRYTSTAKAITHGVAAHLPKEILNFEGFVEDMYSEAVQELILLNRKRYDLLDVNEEVVFKVIEMSEVKKFSGGKSHCFTNGALVLKGKVFEGQQKWMVRPKNKRRIFASDCILMVLPRDFYLSFDKNAPMGKAFERYCNGLKNKKGLLFEDLSGDVNGIEESVEILKKEPTVLMFRTSRFDNN